MNRGGGFITSMEDQTIAVCAAEEINRFTAVTDLIRIVNPSVQASKPSWFNGDYLQLNFGDVISEVDARSCNTHAPNINDIQSALEFTRNAWMNNNAMVVVSCDYGASRSPALAYVLWADKLGVGRELEAFTHILNIRPEAVPNNLVVYLGDLVLKRNNSLLKPLYDFNKMMMKSLGLQ